MEYYELAWLDSNMLLIITHLIKLSMARRSGLSFLPFLIDLSPWCVTDKGSCSFQGWAHHRPHLDT